MNIITKSKETNKCYFFEKEKNKPCEKSKERRENYYY